MRPVIVVLETRRHLWRVSTLGSEWVRRIAAKNHPLLNKWKDHKNAIKLGLNRYPERRRTFPDAIRSGAVARMPAARGWREEVRTIREDSREARGGRGLPQTEDHDETVIDLFKDDVGAMQIAAVTSAIGVPDGIRTRVTAVKVSGNEVTDCNYKGRMAPSVPYLPPWRTVSDGYWTAVWLLLPTIRKVYN